MMNRFRSINKPMMASLSGSCGRYIQMHKNAAAFHVGGIPGGNYKAKPFSLIWDWLVKTPDLCEDERAEMSNLQTTYKILGPGMILMQHYLSLKDQVDIVNLCEKWGTRDPGGFYTPSYQNGEQLRLRVMCFGRNWDPTTGYRERSEPPPPPIPSQLVSLAETAVQDAQTHLNELPSMRPDLCLVNFYSPTYGQRDLHQDCDESSESLQKGLPVVSICIGDSAGFLYGHTSDENQLESAYLSSGDVLIFGGESRLIYHGVNHVFPYTAPMPLKQETNLRPGRLNLTFRQF